MKLLPIFGVLLGVVTGIFFPTVIPKEWSIYVALSVLAGFDSVIGALCSYLEHKFDIKIFVSGFIFNIFLAVVLTYIGNLMSIDIYLAVIVVFGTRMIQNLAKLRRILLNFDKKSDKL